jgi:hypothetical protein
MSALGNDVLAPACSVRALDGATARLRPPRGRSDADPCTVRRLAPGPEPVLAAPGGSDAAPRPADASARATAIGDPAQPVAVLRSSAMTARCSSIVSRRALTWRMRAVAVALRCGP